jgi:hypothetical protein
MVTFPLVAPRPAPPTGLMPQDTIFGRMTATRKAPGPDLQRTTEKVLRCAREEQQRLFPDAVRRAAVHRRAGTVPHAESATVPGCMSAHH